MRIEVEISLWGWTCCWINNSDVLAGKYSYDVLIVARWVLIFCAKNSLLDWKRIMNIGKNSVFWNDFRCFQFFQEKRTYFLNRPLQADKSKQDCSRKGSKILGESTNSEISFLWGRIRGNRGVLRSLISKFRLISTLGLPGTTEGFDLGEMGTARCVFEVTDLWYWKKIWSNVEKKLKKID